MKRFSLPIVGIFFAFTLFATTMEIETPGGKVSIRITEETMKEKVELDSPYAVIAQIKKDLRGIRKYAAGLSSKKDRQEANELIDEIEDLVILLYTFQKKIVVVEKPVVILEEDSIQAMSTSAFNTLLENLKEESFSENKLNLLKQASKNNYFTVSQLLLIMDTFTMDEDKVEAVRLIYPAAIDKENAFKLQSKVTFSDSKEEILKIISE